MKNLTEGRCCRISRLEVKVSIEELGPERLSHQCNNGFTNQ